MDMSLVRHAERSYYPQVISVVDVWWDGRKPADMLPRLFFVHFRPSGHVAEHGGQIVGFDVGFVSQTFPNEAYIHFVGVHLVFRKAGLARSLYERFFNAVMEASCRRVHCVTSPLNRGTIAFDCRMGFVSHEGTRTIEGVPVAEACDGPREDRVLLTQVLG